MKPPSSSLHHFLRGTPTRSSTTVEIAVPYGTPDSYSYLVHHFYKVAVLLWTYGVKILTTQPFFRIFWIWLCTRWTWTCG